MDQAQARALLAAERARLQRLLQAAAGEAPAAAAERGALKGGEEEPAPSPSLGIRIQRDNRTR